MRLAELMALCACQKTKGKNRKRKRGEQRGKRAKNWGPHGVTAIYILLLSL